MRALTPLVVVLVLSLPAVSRAAEVAATTAATAAATPTAAQVEDLRDRLLTAQQTIATLERRLATEQNRAVALDTCRVKNGRLVAIGKQLIEGYERRYRMTHNDPLQLGRRRFEFELQALSQSVYENLADAPPKPAPAADPGTAPPAPSAARGVPLAPPEILPPTPDRNAPPAKAKPETSKRP